MDTMEVRERTKRTTAKLSEREILRKAISGAKAWVEQWETMLRDLDTPTNGDTPQTQPHPQSHPTTTTPSHTKRNWSPETRRRMARAMRKRWRAAKASGKRTLGRKHGRKVRA